MSFASAAKRRLPWLDVSRVEEMEKHVRGLDMPDAIADLVITLFEELSAQSAARAAERTERAIARQGDDIVCIGAPKLGDGKS